MDTLTTVRQQAEPVQQPISAEATHALDNALASGLAWTAVFRWAAQLVSWLATFYAARILLPADYGVVAMASVAVGLVRLLEGFGLDAILVQDRDLTGERQARVAGFIFATSIAIIASIWLAAPAVALFFGEPQVAWIIRVMSFVLIFDALQVVPRATLQRRLRFRHLAIISFMEVSTTAVVLIAAVTFGVGYWALVFNTLAGALVATGVLLLWAPFGIAWPGDLATIARPLLQGWRVLGSRIAWYGYSTADRAIVGRALGKELLGAYSFSVTLSTVANDEIASIVGRVAPGIFSRIQHQRDELRRYYLILTELLTVLAFPVAVGLCVTADLLVPLLLGPEWSAAILPMQLLCLYSAFLSSQNMNSHVLMWTGQFRVHMWLSILCLVAMPLTLLVAVRYGLAVVGVAWAFAFPVFNLPAFYYAFRTIDAGWRDWLTAITPAAIGCVIMTVAVVVVRIALARLAAPLTVTTALAVVTGATAYGMTLWFAFNARVRVLLEVIRVTES